jgi:hypothetical protein
MGAYVTWIDTRISIYMVIDTNIGEIDYGHIALLALFWRLLIKSVITSLSFSGAAGHQ